MHGTMAIICKNSCIKCMSALWAVIMNNTRYNFHLVTKLKTILVQTHFAFVNQQNNKIVKEQVTCFSVYRSQNSIIFENVQCSQTPVKWPPIKRPPLLLLEARWPHG